MRAMLSRSQEKILIPPSVECVVFFKSIYRLKLCKLICHFERSEESAFKIKKIMNVGYSLKLFHLSYNSNNPTLKTSLH